MKLTLNNIEQLRYGTIELIADEYYFPYEMTSLIQIFDFETAIDMFKKWLTYIEGIKEQYIERYKKMLDMLPNSKELTDNQINILQNIIKSDLRRCLQTFDDKDIERLMDQIIDEATQLGEG